jgi:thioredoxin 1
MGVDMKVITSEAEFESEVIECTVPVLVCLSALAWCPPCRALHPILESFADEVSDRVKVVSIDIDDLPEIAKELSVRSVPTLILFKNGVEIKTRVGMATKKDLHDLIG